MRQNGKPDRNAKGQFLKGNSFAPKPGEVRNPKGRPKRKTLTELMHEWFAGAESGDEDERLRKYAELLIRESRVGTNPAVRSKAMDAVIGRIDPVAKEPPQVIIPVLNVHTETHRTFIDRVNTMADGQPPTPDMVLKALEAEEMQDNASGTSSKNGKGR